MSRFWLAYCNPSGRLLGVVILDSPDIIQARTRAAVEGIDQGASTFCEGHELDEAAASLVPETAIGRMLKPGEAVKVIRRMERGIPKRPAAASVRRSVKRKRA